MVWLVLEELVALLVGQQRLFIGCILGSVVGAAAAVLPGTVVFIAAMAVVIQLFVAEVTLLFGLVGFELFILVETLVRGALVLAETAVLAAVFGVVALIVGLIVEFFVAAGFFEVVGFFEAFHHVSFFVVLLVFPFG